MSDFYGTRVFIEAEVDGGKDVALVSLADILEGLIEREDIISCGGEIGPEGILDEAEPDSVPHKIGEGG